MLGLRFSLNLKLGLAYLPGPKTSSSSKNIFLLSDFFNSLITVIIFNLAGAPGFEPGMAGSKPAALPLG